MGRLCVLRMLRNISAALRSGVQLGRKPRRLIVRRSLERLKRHGVWSAIRKLLHRLRLSKLGYLTTLRMPLPANFHSTVKEVLEAYSQPLTTVICQNTSGKALSHVQSQRKRESLPVIAGELLGGHWAIYPPSPADYFVKCLCGCTEVYTVCQFESHAGEA